MVVIRFEKWGNFFQARGAKDDLLWYILKVSNK